MNKLPIPKHILTGIYIRTNNLALTRIRGSVKDIFVYPHMGVLPMRREVVVLWLN